jgi:hypothetical protein
MIASGAKHGATSSWREEKDVINDITRPGSVFLHFGWTTHGMGKKRGWRIHELRLVCHGPGSSDTICMAEIRDSQQTEMGIHWNPPNEKVQI